MEKVKIKHQLINKSLYNTDDFYFISCKNFWDGGFETSASLEEKYSFYKLANKFSNIIKEILIELKDDVIIGKTISEKSYIFEKWSDINRYDAFMNLTENINKHSHYLINIKNDGNIIDYIVENNFRYLTCIDLYLLNNKIIIQPTCHSEVIIYAENYTKIIPIVQNILKNYNDVYCFQNKTQNK